MFPLEETFEQSFKLKEVVVVSYEGINSEEAIRRIQAYEKAGADIVYIWCWQSNNCKK